MNVANAIRTATNKLLQTSDTARLDAELLMAHALGLTRSDMLVRAMRDPAPENYTDLVERRATHEPVAHIIGSQEFFGRAFRVTPDTLIPRGDSEILVEAALELRLDASRVLDLGTGTGALLLSVLAETGATGIGTDKNAKALDVAMYNAKRLHLADRADLRLLDWHSEGWATGIGQFDLVLCNPPYVEADAVLDPDVDEYEPHSALYAGTEGLDDYRTLFPQLRALMAEKGVAILEIGHEQADAVRAIATSEGFAVELRRDLANRPRALVLT